MSKDKPPNSKPNLLQSSAPKNMGAEPPKGRDGIGSIVTRGFSTGTSQPDSKSNDAWGGSFKGWKEGSWGGTKTSSQEISERIRALRITDKDREQFRPELDCEEVQLVREHIRKASDIAKGITDQSQKALALSYLQAADGINESPLPSRETIVVTLLTLMTAIANFNDLREFVEYLICLVQNIKGVL